MSKKKNLIRYSVIAGIFIIAVFIYGGRLLNMQIANAEQYQRPVSIIAYRESFVIPAIRGEIFDRYGVPLVTNQHIFTLTVDGAKIPKAGRFSPLADTEHILNLINLIYLHGGEIVPHKLPVIAIANENGIRYSYNMETSNRNFIRFLDDNEMPPSISADELVSRLSAKYRLDELMPPEERDYELFLTVLGICYDIDREKIVPNQNRFLISENISEALIKAVSENAHNYRGAEIIQDFQRIYHVPHSAPHLIGRVGQITAEQWPRYKEMGYPMNAKVGLNGVEAAFEEYLRGWDGLLWRAYDREGNIIEESYVNPHTGIEQKPIPGKNVYLTIDIKLQQVAEYSLPKTINRIHAEAAKTPNPEINGADAKAGAVSIINLRGEVLALATYPSYNLETFNEDFAELREREEDSPMTNRALQGRYAPGSVFKVVTSIAALGSNHLRTDEHIFTRGIYTQYEGYQPACWRWHLFGGSSCHGSINVGEALKVSCNYFYFVVAERMAAASPGDIQVLNSYAHRLGLGVRTGVEVGEERGVTASRAHSVANAGTWRPGDTLQSAIGQSDYLFTPIQMATMLGTVLNGGTRYENRLLLYVKEYGSDDIYYAPEPKIADHIDISPEHLNVVKTGMNEVTDTGGTAAVLFRDLPGLTTGGKTGTAQVGASKSPNATIVLFAPYSEPEISLSVVIENGRHGTWAGFTAEDIFAYYFNYKTFNESLDRLDIPDEPEDSESDLESESDGFGRFDDE
jgi:penicillin-binding protein 2